MLVYTAHLHMYFPHVFVCSYILERLQTLFYSWLSEFPWAESYTNMSWTGLVTNPDQLLQNHPKTVGNTAPVGAQTS